MVIKIINLTPHSLNIYKNDELVETINSSGSATAEMIVANSKLKVGYPIVVTKIKGVEGLPEPTENTVLFVSGMVRTALPYRRDLISPSSNRDKIVRDETGRIQGLRAFDSNY